jgi:tRNA threonylcarbamoyladenosine biosynthesis protein TsaB
MSPATRLLAIDTATQACSAALAVGETVLTRYEEPGHGHAERILPMVDELLSEAGLGLRQLDALAFGRGPGAFTGLRIAAGVAQGLAFGAGLPVIAVSDLAALAERALGELPGAAVIVCMDARMGEVYWASFGREDGTAVPLGAERVTSPAGVALEGHGLAPSAWLGAGTGFAAHPDLAARLGLGPMVVAPGLLPRAHEVLVVARREFAAGRVTPAEEAWPVYLRDSVAVPRGP